MQVKKFDTFSGHRDSVYTLAASARDNCFFSAGGDGQVILWDLAKPDLGNLLAHMASSVYSLQQDPATNFVWVGQNFDGLHIIDPVDHQIIGTIHLGEAPIFDLLIKDNTVYAALGNGLIVLVDATDKSIRKYVKASNKSVRTLDISPVDRTLAAGYSDHKVRIWSADNMELRDELTGHTNSVFVVKYSPKGDLLLSAGRDASLRIWDVHNRYQLVENIVAHMYAINDLVYSPDGSQFATCSMDKSIRIWDSQTFRLLKAIDRESLAGHGTSVNKLLWAGNKNMLISCSDDRTISVWEIFA